MAGAQASGITVTWDSVGADASPAPYETIAPAAAGAAECSTAPA